MKIMVLNRMRFKTGAIISITECKGSFFNQKKEENTRYKLKINK